MSRIAHNSVNGRLNRNTFCSGAEVAPVQCKRGLRTRKGKVPPNSLFVCQMLLRQHQEENDLTPGISGLCKMECTEHSVTTLQNLKNR